MHGSFTHRVTCSLYPEQFFRLTDAARKMHTHLAPFVREAALAYLDRKTLLPKSLEENLRAVTREVRRVGTNLNQIAERANTFQRVTHDDLRVAGALVVTLERQMQILKHILENLPYDRQIHLAEDAIVS
jgi:hypothetical protein